MSKTHSFWAAMCVGAVVVACLAVTDSSAQICCAESWALSSPVRKNSSLIDRRSSIKTILMISPTVDIFEFSAGGVRESVDEWSSQAKKNIAVVIENELQGKWDLAVKRLPNETVGGKMASALQETLNLYYAVEMAIAEHAYPSGGRTVNVSLFPDKVTQFDYSLGSEVNKLAAGADAIFLIRGLEQKATGGRKAVQMSVAILSILTSPLTRSFTIPEGSGGVLSAALVDAKTGDILWYKRAFDVSGLETPEGALTSVRQLLADFPPP